MKHSYTQTVNCHHYHGIDFLYFFVYLFGKILYILYYRQLSAMTIFFLFFVEFNSYFLVVYIECHYMENYYT